MATLSFSLCKLDAENDDNTGNECDDKERGRKRNSDTQQIDVFCNINTPSTTVISTLLYAKCKVLSKPNWPSGRRFCIPRHAMQWSVVSHCKPQFFDPSRIWSALIWKWSNIMKYGNDPVTLTLDLILRKLTLLPCDCKRIRTVLLSTSVCLSVCPSVCLSVKRVDSDKKG